MAHVLEDVMRDADGFLIIGASEEGRFPAFSYHAYTLAKKRFYCVDIDGLPESRGPTKGGKVYASVAELPDDVGDLAILWVKPHTAVKAVDMAHEAGCTRVWFSFKTGHRDAVARAKELGMEVVEVGRCPVYYLADEGKPGGCKMHTAITRISGTYAGPPRTAANPKARELF